MEKNKPIHIVFTADENYVRHLGVTLMSLLQTKDAGSFMRISVLGDGLSEKSLNALTVIAGNNNTAISFPKVDFDAYNGLKIGRYLSRATYGKFAIPDIIDDDKVLYLDSDILVRADVSRLWEIDVSGYYTGAVVDSPSDYGPDWHYEHNRKLGVPPDEPYFNAGVMLLNLKKIRRDQLARKAIDFKLQNPDTGYVDQDAFNAVMWGRWLTLHPSWNVQTNMFAMYNDENRRDTLSQEILDSVESPSIVHFTCAIKPWHCEGRWPYKLDFFWPYFEEYYKYVHSLPWKPQKSRMSALKGSLRKHRRKFKQKCKQKIFPRLKN